MGQTQCCKPDAVAVHDHEHVMLSCGADKPSFELFSNLLTDDEMQHVRESVDESNDHTSVHFAKRSKAIRFVMIINGRVQVFSQNYFAQPKTYNDFSGGYRRYYGLVKEELFENSAPLAKFVLKFADYYSIPPKTAMLVQVQTSYFDAPEYRRNIRVSVTGQGIHTDGLDRSGILCLHRGKLIEGAENQFHGSLDGSEPLCDPVRLEAGDCAFFKDNEIYHYVTRGAVAGEWSDYNDISRTVVIIHSAAEMVMDQIENPRNTLGTKGSLVKLRDEVDTYGQRIDDVATIQRASVFNPDHED